MEQLKQILQLKNDGIAIREIARRIGVSRNSVRKYLSLLNDTINENLTSKDWLIKLITTICLSLIRKGISNFFNILNPHNLNLQRPALPVNCFGMSTCRSIRTVMAIVIIAII